MAYIVENRRLSRDFALLRATEPSDARMGQFCMLRAWEGDPLLARPISIFDSDGLSLSFLVRVVGRGTSRLASLRAGDELDVGRALGTPFPDVSGRVALVGGGAGIAPMHFAARTLRARGCVVDSYMGFTDEVMLTDEFAATSDALVVDVGGYITDRVDPSRYDVVFSCGPEPMQRALHDRCASCGTKLYVSLERKMACGIGVCLGCSCASRGGRRKVCTDGPVFESGEVF